MSEDHRDGELGHEEDKKRNGNNSSSIVVTVAIIMGMVLCAYRILLSVSMNYFNGFIKTVSLSYFRNEKTRA